MYAEVDERKRNLNEHSARGGSHSRKLTNIAIGKCDKLNDCACIYVYLCGNSPRKQGK